MAGAETSGGPPAYYGTVDATLLWISLLADAWRWGMPDATVARAAAQPATRRCRWLEHHADPDGDGFVEYLDTPARGLANQGWKDSGDAIRFHDGTLAQPPIALCEVQGYAHRAALDAAALLDAFDPARRRRTVGAGTRPTCGHASGRGSGSTVRSGPSRRWPSTRDGTPGRLR